MITSAVESLLQYGLDRSFFEKNDLQYMRNRICSFLKLEGYEPEGFTVKPVEAIQPLLDQITLWAFENNLIKSVHSPYGDLFDTALMDIVCPRPSRVIAAFEDLHKVSPQKAMTWYYTFSQATNYIRMDRVARNVVWNQATAYGDMIMTINLSKPEKDPKAIIEAAKLTSSTYPKCLLCVENVGFEGNLNLPPRQTHRVIPLTLDAENWVLQYSPYVYYNEHAIVINEKHVPMTISAQTYRRLCDFVDQVPHYFVGSNADLPLVGGSMLSHDHYQAGHFEMPMARADRHKTYCITGFEDVSVSWLKWPLTVLRVSSTHRQKAVDLAVKITDGWKTYTSSEDELVSHTGNERHHTVTPIVRMNKGQYEIDVVLRDNQRSEEYPDGIYHPHVEVHPVKKENIGLIEVMGLAVLPSRLKETIDAIVEGLEAGKSYEDMKGDPLVEGFEAIYKKIERSIDSECTLLEKTYKIIGDVFVEGLEHAGVMKVDDKGERAMERFIVSLNEMEDY